MKPIFVRGISNQFRLTLAIILSVILLVANHRLDPARESLSSALSPIQYLASLPGAMLDWSSESFATRNMLALQNKELLRQQLLMSERLQRFEHLRQENERLRALLGSPAYQDSRKMVAEVMEVASDPAHHYVVLNHGSRSGVFVGQPVVDAQGVVGQVVQVSEMTSRVLLLSDVSHGLPVRITRNDVRLVANGAGELDEIELRHVAKSTDIRVGDLLVTSGLGNRFPEGYPVARVIEVQTEDGQSYARVTAQPLAALDRIRYLLLIWPSPDSGVTLPHQVPVPAADHPPEEAKPDPNSTNGAPSTQGAASTAQGAATDANGGTNVNGANAATGAATTPPPAEVH
ncbi:rod shape-determining protein MreC [Shewanella sp. CG12_big_fil_rev_8_21_14_0_65_47_15]|uniref:rod shape-determining protein MreC n=1 Tax=Shewanella sp. CG12_big_fil_rev_8_21_14_0_65_47_15 TaxID=1975537 RepID=UPI000CB06927|nr:rod shape-determining protein MreC [Shewanella sp. CG12_big_fil_rev_8_21_14_0_65_47_15]PIW59977.1 MAG: rod shape-determining protein MreC [Shewanella sp. CG12_big_fil_rev_8_21_14_0_65_47_15]